MFFEDFDTTQTEIQYEVWDYKYKSVHSAVYAYVYIQAPSSVFLSFISIIYIIVCNKMKTQS